MSNPRNPKIDVLKGVAIILVILGHSLQYLNDGTFDFWHNWVFVTIYSFHMPLFMVISGYISYSGIVNRTLLENIKQRLLQLMLPTAAWSVLMTLLPFGPNGIMETINFAIEGYWFISALFAISIMAALIEKFSPKHVALAYLATILLLQILPDGHNVVMVKFLFPYFALGIYLVKLKSISNAHRLRIGLACLLLLPMILIFWQKDYYIYTTGMAYYHLRHVTIDKGAQFINNMYRYFAGFIGSGAVIFLVSKVYREGIVARIVSKLGSASFGIYMVQKPIFDHFLAHRRAPSIFTDNIFVYNFIIAPAFACLILVVCYLVIVLLRQNESIRKIFLGGR